MALDNVKNIVLVLSGKGGVGKSSITTQLALSLSLAGHSVGILDIDLTGPSIPRFLGIESSKIKQAPGGWLPVEVHPSQTLSPLPSPPSPPSNPTQNGVGHSTPSAHNSTSLAPRLDPDPDTVPDHANPIGSLHAMSLAFLLADRSSAVVWRGPKKTAMVRQFLSDVLWPPLDFLLIDTPPGTSDEHISVVETLLQKVYNPPASASLNGNGGGSGGEGGSGSRREKIYPALAGAVIVTTPQDVAVADVRKEVNFCAKTGVRVVGVVENMSGYVCPCCGVVNDIFSKGEGGGGEGMAAGFEVPFLGSVAIDALWGQLVEEGVRPVYGGERLNGGEGEEDAGGMSERDRMEGVEEGGDMEDGVRDERPRDEALLVDKYRSCSLYPTFRDITGKVLEIVERGTAVRVKSSGTG